VEPLDLSAEITEMQDLFRASLPDHIQLEIHPGENPLEILADRILVQQVLMNLVTNAMESIGNNQGTISISTGNTRLNNRLLTRMLSAEKVDPGDFVFIAVSDTGCGMNEDTKSRIFDPFFTTKFVGRGLGLSAVMGIARSHHAVIEVDSSPGKGSTMKLYFPVFTPENPSGSQNIFQTEPIRLAHRTSMRNKKPI